MIIPPLIVLKEPAETLFISGFDAAEFGLLEVVSMDMPLLLSEIEHSLELVWLLIPDDGELGKELEDSLMMSKTDCGPDRVIIK